MSLPHRLLSDVCWSFSEPVPGRPADLIKAAAQYADESDFPDPTISLLTQLPFTDVRLVYVYSERQQDEWADIETEVRIVSADGRLTGADVLWELHVHCQHTVGKSDKCFFEGLELVEQRAGVPPKYRVILGS